MQTPIKKHLINDVFISSVDISGLEVIKPVNKKLFGERRIINDYDHPDLMILVAYIGDVVAGFKIGYGLNNSIYYSAKSGVLPGYRRNGIATKLLYRMILDVKRIGYEKLVYDTSRHASPV